MNIRATSNFRPGNLAAIEEKIASGIIAAVKEGASAIANDARILAPVDTGELRESIGSITTLEGQRVIGTIHALAPHAAFVEFGTGIRGAASEGAGPVSYNPEWPGMPAQPYLRPALDNGKAAIISAFRELGFRE